LVSLKDSWNSFWWFFTFSVTFKFGILVQDTVDTDYRLELVFTGDWVVKKDAYCTCKGLASSTTCVASKSLNKITLTNFVSSTTPMFTTFSFTVNMIKKSSFSFTSGSVLFDIYDISSTLIDSGTATFT
jgi:hypothetical protein